MKHQFNLDGYQTTFCVICASEDSSTDCFGKGKYLHNIVKFDNVKSKCLKCDFNFYKIDEIINNQSARIHYFIDLKRKEVQIIPKTTTSKYIESFCMYSDDAGVVKNIIE